MIENRISQVPQCAGMADFMALHRYLPKFKIGEADSKVALSGEHLLGPLHHIVMLFFSGHTLKAGVVLGGRG